MTSALEILSDDFPHGSPDGARLGCRTNHCPAPIACHVVQRRYAGDLQFRRRVDSGLTVADIAAVEVAEAAEKREAERAANRRIREAVKRETKAAKKMRRYRYGEKVAGTPQTFSPEDVTRLRELHASGMTDKDIAAAMGRAASSISSKRAALELPRNMPPREIEHGTIRGYAAGCTTDCPSTPSCVEGARAEWRARAAAKRRRDGIEERHTEAEYAEARRLWAEGNNTLTAIAERLGMSRKTVGRVVNPDGGPMLRTRCRNNHEFTPENTYLNVREDGTRRICRTCRAAHNRDRRDYHAEYRKRKKEQAA